MFATILPILGTEMAAKTPSIAMTSNISTRENPDFDECLILGHLMGGSLVRHLLQDPQSENQMLHVLFRVRDRTKKAHHIDYK